MQDHKNIYLGIAGAAVLLAVFLILQKRSAGTGNAVAPVTFGKVDGYRIHAIQQKKLEQERVKVDNYMHAPEVNTRYRVEAQEPTSDRIILETPQHHAAKDSAEPRQQQMPDFSPEAQINRLLVDKQKYEQMSAMDKQRYIQAFKKEAKNLGFKIEFNNKLEIIQFEKMPSSGSREPSADELYQGEEFY